ncbi:MAG: hypothetical protein OXF01_13250 [Gemmatimonadetes bacterium]|nr:hypothetical protein [Gemmatimonadota bacterium]
MRDSTGATGISVLHGRAEIVIGLFRELFGCEGERFGSPPLGVSGIHDGTAGVQWNAWYQRDESAWLGVNLEGKEYDGWPIARLIERELCHPRLLSVRVARPEIVTVSWKRDAWQASNRVRIMESHIAPTPTKLIRLDGEDWARALGDARECLDPKRDCRGRRRISVTLRPSGRLVERWVSPHLSFRTPLHGVDSHTMRQARDNLEGLHEFAAFQSKVDARGASGGRR